MERLALSYNLMKVQWKKQIPILEFYFTFLNSAIRLSSPIAEFNLITKLYK